MRSSKIAAAALLLAGALMLSACGGGGGNSGGGAGSSAAASSAAPAADGIEITKEMGKGVISVTVPKKDDKAKYEFTETKPKKAIKSGTFYLETDNAVITFGSSGMVYHTGQAYKQKYGEVKPSFEDYLKWIDDPDSKIDLKGLEKLDIGDRKAIRYYTREGGGNDFKYFGYIYLIAGEDIYPGSRIDLGVYYKDEEPPKEAKELDEETLSIINSFKLTAKS